MISFFSFFQQVTAVSNPSCTQKYAAIKKTNQQPVQAKSDSSAPWLPSSKDMQVGELSNKLYGWFNHTCL